MERFVGQVAVVTGASGGIASATTKELLKRKVNVVGLDKNVEKLKQLEDEVSKNKQLYPGQFYPKVCDITNDELVRKTFEWINTNLKTFAILINAAGVLSTGDDDLQNFNADDFDFTFGVNVKGLLSCTREALNSMTKNSVAGHIINICSCCGFDKFAHETYYQYTSSKQAVRVLSDILRRQITKKRSNIKVTTLSPGVVRTEILIPTFLRTHEVKEEILNPEDIANGCIAVLDTPPNVQISEITVEPIYQIDIKKIFE